MNKTGINSKKNMKSPRSIFIKINQSLLNSNIPLIKSPMVFWSLILIIILMVGFLSMNFTKKDSNIPTFSVKKGDLDISINESGELRAKKSITLSAPRIGRSRLKIIYLIPEGTYIEPETVVARFDPAEGKQKLKEAESKLEMAYSEKKKLEANQLAAKAQMESNLKSSELNFQLSKLRLEQIKFEADIKQQEAKLNHQKNELSFKKTKQEYLSKKIIQKSEMDKMNLEINQKKTELKKAQDAVNNLTLKSKAKGLVVYNKNWSNSGRKFSIGDETWGGARIISLPDLSQMQSITNVNEIDISKIKKGLKVNVRLDAFRDKVFNGVISSVANLGKNKSRDSKIKVFKVVVDILEQSEILKPGMTTSNKIIIQQLKDITYLPYEAVFQINNQSIVYLSKGRSFKEKVIKTGIKGLDFIEVLEGVKSNDLVALLDPFPSSQPEKMVKNKTAVPVNGQE